MSESKDQRVEKHSVYRASPYFPMLLDFCHKAKNLYNHANFVVRQAFISEQKWLRYPTLDRLLKADKEFPDYASMPTAQTAQQVLRMVDKNWKSFFASMKDWKKHPEKYYGKPALPGYLKKDGCYILVLTNQNCRFTDGVIRFPKAFNGLSISPKFKERADFEAFHQVRLIPHKSRIVVELVYSIKLEMKKPDNGRYIGVDIGVNNLMTISNNMGEPAFSVNGRPAKAFNQFYNKRVSHYRELCRRMNDRHYSRRMDRLTEKRNAKMDDYLHKASRWLIHACLDRDICTIVIGKNAGWKQNSKLSRQINQNFVQIPFARLIKMIQYKAEEVGITVILTEESYTSGTSFIDDEEPVKENYNKSRRIHRGLFRSNGGTEINADLNGAYQILRKVFPIKWDRGWALHPVVVDL